MQVHASIRHLLQQGDGIYRARRIALHRASQLGSYMGLVHQLESY